MQKLNLSTLVMKINLQNYAMTLHCVQVVTCWIMIDKRDKVLTFVRIINDKLNLVTGFFQFIKGRNSHVSLFSEGNSLKFFFLALSNTNCNKLVSEQNRNTLKRRSRYGGTRMRWNRISISCNNACQSERINVKSSGVCIRFSSRRWKQKKLTLTIWSKQ